jgi:CBS-domain-containing membrane protein
MALKRFVVTVCLKGLMLFCVKVAKFSHVLHCEKIDSTVANIMNQSPIVAYADETLRELAYRMADSRITHMPVVLRDDLTHLVGMVSQADLLKGRLLDLQEESDVERVLRIHRIIPFQLKTTVKR